jgi:hypothetical protein
MRKTLIVVVATAALVASVAAIGALAFAGSPEDRTVARGEAETVEGLTWSVVSAQQRRRIAIPEGLTYTAKQGVYLIVELKLDNASGGAARAVGEYVTLLGSDGKRYGIDEDGSNAYHLTLGPHRHDPALYEPTRPDPIFYFFDVPVGNARAASMTFDVPRAALRNTPLIEVQPPDGSRTAFELSVH